MRRCVVQGSQASRARWMPVREELARWRGTDCVARLWLRDDDAIAVTPALIRLANLCSAGNVPYLIAAIPSRADRDLPAFMTEQPLGEVAAHGWTHHNHASREAKKAEFPIHRTQPEILRELARARARIEDLFADKAMAIYVPPWNRIAPEIATMLPDVGFKAVSALGRKPILAMPSRLIELNVHIDIIDWHGSRGGREPDVLATELAAQLSWARTNGRPATGILTHHLVHDEIAWQFMEELLAETAEHPAVRWFRPSELIVHHS